MEVKKIIGVLSIALFLSACANNTQKTPQNVLESKVDATSCQSEMLENKYVVLWEDGSFSYENAENEETFKNEFITKNLQQIKKVYYDRKIKFLSTSESESQPDSSGALSTVTPTAATESAQQQWGQTMISAKDVWDKNFYGQGVIVGVVDSYVDTSHSMLKEQIYTNTDETPDNGIDDDKNGFVDDYHGMNFTGVSNYSITNVHGTHVSGIIGASHTGLMKGIAPKAKIIPAPFITNDGSGSLGDAIKAMSYVVSRGAKVINASWGGSACVSSLKDAFQAISSQGVLIVVAAGNDGRDLTVSPTYPAAFNLPGQITVGASNENDFMAYFSNSSFSLVHLAAPGDAIFSTTPSDKYDYLKGTSMAAPFVTGAAAVLWSAFPNATVAQIKEAIINSVDVQPSHEFRVSSRGRLNLSKAYNYLNK